MKTFSRGVRRSWKIFDLVSDLFDRKEQAGAIAVGVCGIAEGAWGCAPGPVSVCQAGTALAGGHASAYL